MFCSSSVVVMSVPFRWVVRLGGTRGRDESCSSRPRNERPARCQLAGLEAGGAVTLAGPARGLGAVAVLAGGVLSLAGLVLDGGGIADRFGDAGLLLVVLAG